MSNASGQAFVEAELNYLRYTGARPVNYTFEPPPDPLPSGLIVVPSG